MAARKQNMWPFGSSSKTKKKTARRPSRSMMTAGQSMDAAYKAGQKSGDTGQFKQWLEFKGLSNHSATLRDRLRKEYDRGVDQGEGVTRKAAVKGVTYKGYAIRPTEDGSYVIPRLDADSHFDSLKDAKEFLNDWKRNMGRKQPAKKARKTVKRKGNPAAESVDAYKEFHGREPDDLVTVKKEIHYHRHLAGAGKLEKIVVRSARQGARVLLSDFKGALLAFNEKRTQLFVEGGDQQVDLRQFGIKAHPHEQEVLGEVLAVEYFTRKDHLRPEDGGEAIYVHKFSKPLPTLIYDVLNEQLTFSGGSYVILPEGIDR